MTTPFRNPGGGGGDRFVAAEHIGKLLLVYPKTHVESEPTTNGSQAMTEADIVVVETRQAFNNARLWGNLAKSTRPSGQPGDTILGRLGQGENKRGNAPWVLFDPTDADAALALPVHSEYQRGAFRAAAQPQQAPPPAHDPWAGMNVQQQPPQQPYQPPPAAGPPVAPTSALAQLAARGVNVQGMDEATAQQILKLS